MSWKIYEKIMRLRKVSKGIGYYENLCGEETPDSTYFEPKIRVRGQQCNSPYAKLAKYT